MADEKINPLNIKLPGKKEILLPGIELASVGDMRIPQLANLLGEDPVITLELLREANTLDRNSTKLNIINVRAAVVRLGMSSVVKVLTGIVNRPVSENQEVAARVENLRILCQEASFVAQTISSIAYRDLTEVSQMAGLFAYVGHMIACMTLKEKYLNLSKGLKQSSLAYRLQQNYSFNITTVLLEYLESHKIVPEIVHAFNKDVPCKTATQVNLRFILQSAVELVDAVHKGKWKKYHPNYNLPTKSAIRFLRINGQQYLAIHELISVYFSHLLEKKRDEQKNLHIIPEPNQHKDIEKEEELSYLDEDYLQGSSSSMLKVLEEEVNYIVQTNTDIKKNLKNLSKRSKNLIEMVEEVCQNSTNVITLLEDVMELLIHDGPYSRAALLVVGDDRKSAQVQIGFGRKLQPGLKIFLKDPLSPLALCLTKMNSFNSSFGEDTLAPLGSSSYFVSPLKLKDKNPFVLYVDNGTKKSLSFEARKVFRAVLSLLNQKIPNLEA